MRNYLLASVWFYVILMCSCRQHRHRTVPGCSRCPPGQYLTRPCDPFQNRNTQCAPCPPGTYSPHHSHFTSCYPCARCGQGLYIAHHCSAKRDTVCDSCHTAKGPHNKDFVIRCLSAGGAMVALHTSGHDTVPQDPPPTQAPSASQSLKMEVVPASSPQILTVLFLSASCSFGLFLCLAALVYARHRLQGRKMGYSPVETGEPVML